MYTGNSQYDANTYRKLKKRKSTPKNKTLSLASEEYYKKTEAFMAEICRRLQDARLRARVSTAELAKATGLTVAAIYKYERQGRISMPTFARVLFALQLEIDVIPFFQEQVSVGKEFEYIVQDLDEDTKVKILQEVRSIVGLIKKE